MKDEILRLLTQMRRHVEATSTAADTVIKELAKPGAWGVVDPGLLTMFEKMKSDVSVTELASSIDPRGIDPDTAREVRRLAMECQLQLDRVDRALTAARP